MRRLRHMIFSSEPCNMRKWLKVVAVITFVVFALATEKNSHATQAHFSTREGRTIRMEPSGAQFHIPQDWEGFYSERAGLREVKKGKGEWTTEYTKVVNAALPFSDCSVQAGRSSGSAVGVTVRGYVLNRSAPEVENRIASKAMSAAKALERDQRTRNIIIRNISETKEEIQGWHRILIAYDVWYYDYEDGRTLIFMLPKRTKPRLSLCSCTKARRTRTRTYLWTQRGCKHMQQFGRF